MSACTYMLAVVGRCRKPTEGQYCEYHADILCSCGNKAVGQCGETGMLVCGNPTCRSFNCHIHEEKARAYL